RPAASPNSAHLPYTTLFRSALGLNIIFNATGAVNFAQGEFAMLGGMLGASILSTTHLPLIVTVVLTVVTVTAIGMLMERLVIRRSEEHTSELQSPDQLVCRL